MQIQFIWENTPYFCSLSEGISLALPLVPNKPNVSCYWAEPPQSTPIEMGSFVGSVARGGSVNYERISLTPHGNGTHTESVGHIQASPCAVGSSLKTYHFLSELISLTPIKIGEDWVVTLRQIQEKIMHLEAPALILRTLPQDAEKYLRNYSGTNPPYLEPGTGEWLREQGYAHLLVDLPSVDKESDGGRLSVHKGFWNYPHAPRRHATLTELIFVPDEVKDGLYLLNLQVPHWETDAAPSRPVIFPIQKIKPQ
jgi:arylformamidase